MEQSCFMRKDKQADTKRIVIFAVVLRKCLKSLARLLDVTVWIRSRHFQVTSVVQGARKDKRKEKCNSTSGKIFGFYCALHIYSSTGRYLVTDWLCQSVSQSVSKSVSRGGQYGNVQVGNAERFVTSLHCNLILFTRNVAAYEKCTDWAPF